jgi:hypothetical protein
MATEDPWAGARTAARDDVRTALVRGTRICPACGAEQETGGRFCDKCGADTTARYRKPPRWRTPAIVVLGLALFALAAYPLVNLLRDDAADERERTAQRQAALEAAEIKRLTEDSKPVRAQGLPVPAGADPVAFRAEQITDAEARITADGQERAAAGRLDGDIKGAECERYPRTAAREAIEADPRAERGRYNCTAYTRTFTAPDSEGEARTGLFGYPYWLVIEYESGDLVWCKVTPRAGEGGQSLASVPVPPPCREPAAAAD